MRGAWRGRVMALASAVALGAAGCGGAADESAARIRVLAAASLSGAFDELASEFQTTGRGVSVELNFGGSSSLREQILAGAPADVFASANTSTMTQVVDAGVVTRPEKFATNQLQIAVPAGNPAGVTGLADFADPDLTVGLCAEEVPCGQLGRDALAGMRITPSIDTNEPNVRALLTKVQAGELDAGIVYRSDVLNAGDAVEGIDIPAEVNVTSAYCIAVLKGSGRPEVAAAFVAFVLSEEGQAILASYGFDAP